jgi:hypothetical protein
MQTWPDIEHLALNAKGMTSATTLGEDFVLSPNLFGRALSSENFV